MGTPRMKTLYGFVMALVLVAGCGGGDLETETDAASEPAIMSESAFAQSPADDPEHESVPAPSERVLMAQATMSAGTFSLKSDNTFFTINTGAGLVFKIRRTDTGSNRQSIGDIASMVYNGVEYQDQTLGSHVNSGFDFLYEGMRNVSVSARMMDADHIKVTVEAGNLTHYYMAKRGHAKIFMATYFTTEPDTLGLARFIVRVPIGVLPKGPVPSNIRSNTGAIESGDIFGMRNGETRSKHYSNMRLKDWTYFGATSSRAGLWFVRDNNEGNSGGPFYRSLLNQGTDTNQELTYIMNYGMALTEAYRPGILNSYTLVFTGGSPPGAVDTSWFARMDLTGFVPPSSRGRVAGVGISGRNPKYKYTVSFSNDKAQYWADVRSTDGFFTSGGMIPGTYVMKIYKNELEVANQHVTVHGGATTTLNSIAITGDPSTVAPVWRIGDWDGAPTEFLNGDKVTTMHPSDVRMRPWTTPDYVVGVSTPANGFPAYQWKAVNGNIRIKFRLGSGQISDSLVRIGITTAHANGRPMIKVNNWTSHIPSPSSQASTRSLTIGTYRGNNTTFSFNIPASALVVGENTLTLNVVSGSGGTGYLSAGVSYDAVEFITMR